MKRKKTKEKSITLQSLQKIALKKRDCLIMHNYRKLSTRITLRLIKTNLLPWHVTLFSIAFGLLAAYFFLLGQHIYLIIGAVFIQLSYLFDCVDGEIARAKGTGSSFGRWLDSLGDFSTTIIAYSAAAVGLFLLTQDSLVLLIGYAAIGNISIMIFATGVKKGLFDPKKVRPSLRLSSKYYIGGRSILVTAITLAALLNQVFILLAFFASFGVLLWAKVTWETWKHK